MHSLASSAIAACALALVLACGTTSAPATPSDDAGTGGDAAVDACKNGVRDGAESDVDCGGAACVPCFDGSLCRSSVDCTGGGCIGAPSRCVTPSCRDGLVDGKESDVDCGGACPDPCGKGKTCRRAVDCASSVCAGGACASASCFDGARNGDETDVDCGGSCARGCAAGSVCGVDRDCRHSLCDTTKRCASPATCANTTRDGGETDVDCGGPACPACADGRACAVAADCASSSCGSAMTCVAASCSDGMRNGSESDVDCGGAQCPSCAPGAACAAPTDCASQVCTPVDGGATCSAPSCHDQMKNGDETDYDCGGSCPLKCLPFQGCVSGADCRGGVCDAMTHACQPSCTDGFIDGSETDLDCGGPCPPCRPNRDCLGPADCTTALCSYIGHGDHCRPAPTCTNATQDNAETDLDCGGPFCVACAPGQRCVSSADCNGECLPSGRCQ